VATTTNLQQWQEVDRGKVRATLLQCLDDMPPRQDPLLVKVVATDDHGDFTVERFQFHNGVDMVVTEIFGLEGPEFTSIEVLSEFRSDAGCFDYLLDVGE
jgi:hypothetical protein